MRPPTTVRRTRADSSASGPFGEGVVVDDDEVGACTGTDDAEAVLLEARPCCVLRAVHDGLVDGQRELGSVGRQIGLVG